MMPKAYTSPGLVRRLSRKTSGAVYMMVPTWLPAGTSCSLSCKGLLRPAHMVACKHRSHKKVPYCGQHHITCSHWYITHPLARGCRLACINQAMHCECRLAAIIFYRQTVSVDMTNVRCGWTSNKASWTAYGTVCCLCKLFWSCAAYMPIMHQLRV